MRLCRFHHEGADQIGFYNDDTVVPLSKAAAARDVGLPPSDNLLDFVTGGAAREKVVALEGALGAGDLTELSLSTGDVKLLVPIPRPSKLLLWATVLPETSRRYVSSAVMVYGYRGSRSPTRQGGSAHTTSLIGHVSKKGTHN